LFWYKFYHHTTPYNPVVGPYVVDLLYPSLVHRLKHHSTALAVSHDGEIMVCNDGQCLHVYEVSAFQLSRCSSGELEVA